MADHGSFWRKVKAVPAAGEHSKKLLQATEGLNRIFQRVAAYDERSPQPSMAKPALLEKDLELAIGKSLEAQGAIVQHQVRCPSGIADIVTSDAIYEIKRELEASTIFSAIGQVLIYRQEINPQAKAYIVGYRHTSQFRAEQVEFIKSTAKSLGVEVLFWDDEKLS
jgi:hypothetical protein